MIKFRGMPAILFWGCSLRYSAREGGAVDQAAPLVVGETFTIDSRILGETRHAYARAVREFFPMRPAPEPVRHSYIAKK